jgi:malonate transporter
MLQIITIVAPLFGMIGLGFLAIKTGYISRDTGKYLAEFAVKLAMPALLFRAMLSIGDMPGSPILLVAAYFAACACVWILASLSTWALLRRPQTDAASIAMGSTFSNSVMLGVPLALSAFGPESAAPAALLISLDTPLLWIAATLHLEAFRQDREGSAMKAIGGIVLSLLKNPIVMALIAGSACRLAGITTLPPLLDKSMELLANAAVPAMLVALGMSIATYKIAGQTGTLSLILILKIVAFPVFAYIFSVHVFELPPIWSAVVILFAAMPVGANAYLFAAKYNAAVGSVSTSIAITTAVAVLTVSGLLFWLKTTI